MSRGKLFDADDSMTTSGAFDELTLWEQIDSGAQYTPAKKWLTSVPIGLYFIHSKTSGGADAQISHIHSLHSIRLAVVCTQLCRIGLRAIPQATQCESTLWPTVILLSDNCSYTDCASNYSLRHSTLKQHLHPCLPGRQHLPRSDNF